MNWIDQIAARLQPLRKRLVIGTLVSFFLCALLPFLAGAVAGRSFPKAIAFAVVIPMLGMTSCWGLFCIAYWYAPGKGPVSPEVLRQQHWLLALYGRFFRLFAPAFLLVWFLAPVVFLIIVLVEAK